MLQGLHVNFPPPETADWTMAAAATLTSGGIGEKSPSEVDEVRARFLLPLHGRAL
jgi:hypothetical protein